jgi:RHS repeat-associated protein
VSETAAGQVAGTVSRTFNSDFRPRSVSVNGAAAASFQYDADGLLTQAGALAIGRDAASGRVSGTTAGAVTTSHAYSSYGELGSVSASSGASALYSYTLSGDALGRITDKTETVQGATSSTTYGYDDAGRLTSVSKDGAVAESYSYDDNGNRLSGTNSGSTANGNYDAQDRMTAYGAASYTYGLSGDLRTSTAGGQTTTYSYDALGNLLGVALPDGRTVEYVVDGVNRRVGKRVNGALVEGFLYDGQLRPVAWLDGAGAVKATFVYGLHVNVPEYMTTSAGAFRILTDHLGSPRLVVDTASGAVVQRMDYDSFGQVLQDTSPGFQPFGFAGGLYDRDTGLVRFGARDYDASTGRWANKDPIRFRGETTNLYEYGLGDPVNFIDPTGLDAQCFAQLKYRPVNYWLAELFGRTHAFWYVQGSNGNQYVLSGGPSGQPQYLNVWVNSDIYGGADNVSATTSWSSGCSSSNCVGADAMIAAAQGWPQNTIPYSPVEGPNSDTAAHTFGTAGGFNPPAPPGTMAWNTPLPH